MRRQQKKQAKANAAKENLVRLAKKTAAMERKVSSYYKKDADRISKMSTRDYIKSITNHDVGTKQGRKAYYDEFGIDPKTHHKEDIDHSRERARATHFNSLEYDKLAKVYGNLDVEGLSKKEVRKKGVEIAKKYGVSSVWYRVR